MTKKMLIDAAHPEETRVVVVDGNRVEEFDFESQNKKQLRGNIYLAKVTRVEPSLQAAFIEYGGNRHGFLAFDEIHPDYYQIPLADREALMRAQAEDDDEETARGSSRSRPAAPAASSDGDDEDGAEVVRGRRRRDGRGGGASPPPPDAQLQDPGSDPPPADHAGPGRQGRARQQGRRPDHLPLPGRPLRRADAQHRPGGGISRKITTITDRKKLKGHRPEPRRAQGHGPDRPHGGRQAHQDRDQARLRLSAARSGRTSARRRCTRSPRR
jgi:ribonuclease E